MWGPKDYFPMASIYPGNKYFSPVHVQDEANLSEILDKINLTNWSSLIDNLLNLCRSPKITLQEPVFILAINISVLSMWIIWSLIYDQFYPKFSDKIKSLFGWFWVYGSLSGLCRFILAINISVLSMSTIKQIYPNFGRQNMHKVL